MSQWRVGQRVYFATFDHQDADTRELDATAATVVEIDEANQAVTVDSIYGRRTFDEYDFVAGR